MGRHPTRKIHYALAVPHTLGEYSSSRRIHNAFFNGQSGSYILYWCSDNSHSLKVRNENENLAEMMNYEGTHLSIGVERKVKVKHYATLEARRLCPAHRKNEAAESN